MQVKDLPVPQLPDLYCLDHDRRVAIPIEFTVADDANLGAAIGRKHAKYDPWLLRNPCASIARLGPVHATHTRGPSIRSL